MTKAPAKPDRPVADIADDVLPPKVDELAVPVPLKKLQAWHRPRKQLVREEQWIRFSERLIEKERNKPGLPKRHNARPEVKYLTLPGRDYIDVAQLAEVCKLWDCSLTSTGFEVEFESNPEAARAKFRETSLMDSRRITRDSHTFRSRLEGIAHGRGKAYRELISRGPFHIVNIDACGSLARPSADHSHRLIDAIYRIVEFQLRMKTGRWLLFITAEARPNSFAEDTLGSLCEAIYSNAEQDDDFRDRALSLLGATDNDIEAAVRAAGESAGHKFLQLIGLGLAKWFLHLARSQEWVSMPK